MNQKCREKGQERRTPTRKITLINTQLYNYNKNTTLTPARTKNTIELKNKCPAVPPIQKNQMLNPIALSIT